MCAVSGPCLSSTRRSPSCERSWPPPQAPISQHLEVETYTWDVLPADLVAGSVEMRDAELKWVLGDAMTFGVILRLGRVSNLPTVWTNALAGAALASGGAPEIGPVLITALALTLFYEGGMWLNDAFDAEIDAREKADRPIPKGEVSRRTVFIGGWALLAAGVVVALGATAAAWSV